MKLGKKPYVHDPRSLRLGKYLAPALPPAPDTKNWSSHVASWPMFANDTVGDCTCAAAGHMIECWSAAAGSEASVGDAEVLAAYSAVSGYDAAQPATDQGAAIIDVLRYWQHTGIAGHTIAAYAEVDPANHDHVRAAVDLFAGLDVGMQMPAAAQGFTDPQWPNPPSPLTAEWEPGSWGGHCVPVVDYTPDGPTAVSWGRLFVMTWDWWDAYVEEAWAIITPDFLASGVTPDGVNLQALQADLADLRQS